MHWRWSGGCARLPTSPGTCSDVDVLVNPSDDSPIDPAKIGTPYLVEGQTIEIAIVKFSAAEFFEDNPTSLVTPPEQLATTKIRDVIIPFLQLAEKVETVTSADNPVVWYMASSKNTPTDTYFKHGMFVIDTSKQILVPPNK